MSCHDKYHVTQHRLRQGSVYSIASSTSHLHLDPNKAFSTTISDVKLLHTGDRWRKKVEYGQCLTPLINQLGSVVQAHGPPNRFELIEENLLSFFPFLSLWLTLCLIKNDLELGIPDRWDLNLEVNPISDF